MHPSWGPSIQARRSQRERQGSNGLESAARVSCAISSGSDVGPKVAYELVPMRDSSNLARRTSGPTSAPSSNSRFVSGAYPVPELDRGAARTALSVLPRGRSPAYSTGGDGRASELETQDELQAVPALADLPRELLGELAASATPAPRARRGPARRAGHAVDAPRGARAGGGQGRAHDQARPRRVDGGARGRACARDPARRLLLRRAAGAGERRHAPLVARDRARPACRAAPLGHASRVRAGPAGAPRAERAPPRAPHRRGGLGPGRRPRASPARRPRARPRDAVRPGPLHRHPAPPEGHRVHGERDDRDGEPRARPLRARGPDAQHARRHLAEGAVGAASAPPAAAEDAGEARALGQPRPARAPADEPQHIEQSWPGAQWRSGRGRLRVTGDDGRAHPRRHPRAGRPDDRARGAGTTSPRASSGCASCASASASGRRSGSTSPRTARPSTRSRSSRSSPTCRSRG